MTLTVSDLRVEHQRGRPIGIGTPHPRLSWTVATPDPGWFQSAYELEVDGVATGRRESADSVLVDWPGPAVTSRGIHRVRVRLWGADGSESEWSEPVTVEV
jgi:alpha-L-rhamnosidase